jgi:ribosome biogenesis GTPase A
MKQKAVRPFLTQSTARAIVDKARAICLRFEILSLGPQMKACENLLGRNQIIDVAILGQFKAGKSSFINSLTRQNVLPVGVIPVTTVITRLHYGDEPKAVVTDFDGKRIKALRTVSSSS